MNDILAVPANGSTLSMTSREIAELTRKEHSHVLRDVRVLLASLYGGSPEDFAPEKLVRNPLDPTMAAARQYGTNASGTPVYEYLLDKDHTLTLLTGYDARARMAVIKRWQELEAQAYRPAAIPQIELQERQVALAERILNIARSVGDDVLVLMAIDSIKNSMTNALPSPEKAGLFQTYEVLESLGYSQKQIRSIASQAGKILKAVYRAQTGEEPKETLRMIDGANRPVKAYPSSWFETAKAVLSDHFAH